MTRARAAIGALACASLLAGCSVDREVAMSPGTVHAAGIADPQSPAWHGGMLRAERWAGMLDPTASDACGRCHAGSPAPVPGITSFAPGATACTTCHAEPTGPLACTTCHTPAGAHGAHLAPSPSSAAGLPCSTCHPTPGAPVIGGLHGDGHVEVVFDPARVAPEASFDAATGACAVACHDRGGARPRPRWTESTPITCGDCHSSPPAAHFAGPCTNCHAEANALGTSLTRGALHMNGRVDLGDGSGTCASCHGSQGDPWPTTGAHRAHASSAISAPVACSNCHVVPSTVLAPGHLDGAVRVTFSGLAVARGANATWDGQRCSEVACHGGALVDSPAVVPAWSDTSGAAATCGACHGIPPTQHTPSTSCERSTCHGAEIARSATGAISIAPGGQALHVNGVIDSSP